MSYYITPSLENSKINSELIAKVFSNLKVLFVILIVKGGSSCCRHFKFSDFRFDIDYVPILKSKSGHWSD